MKKFFQGLLNYPVVIATLSVGVLGGALELSGQGAVAQWVISIFALVIAGIQAKGMVDDLRSGSYGIDLLAVTAIVSTVAVGEYWAALIVCLMLSGGEALEDYAAGRAKRELTELLSNAPVKAHRLGPDGDITEIAVEDVAVGDQLLVRPFEMIPVDAELESNGATLDESSITGESMPVERTRGDRVLSGAINGGDAITVRGTATAADSQYQRIVALVQEAQESKAPFVRLADRVAVPFTIFSLALAGLAWFFTGDPSRMAEVLVVATPCPLIIAAPVAFLGGMSRSARVGIIVKSSGTLEQLAAVRTAAFDKTGTLTYGEPRVTSVQPSNGTEPDELLAMAAAVEQYSGHPLARAILDDANAKKLHLPSVNDANELPANGVRGTVDGREVVVGKAGYIADLTDAEPHDSPVGESAVHVAIDGRYAGLISLADELRAETRLTMDVLRRAGVQHTMMITGDHHHVAEHIAEQSGLTDVQAELLPEDKVRAIADASDHPVMMVGDGVNDAPSLAAADVGIAMGARGSTAASESADVVIMLDDLSRAARAVLIGKRTMRVAWQAIGIGVGMSVALMIVAALGFLPAVAGALMQELVDLACILWALLAMRPSKEELALPELSEITRAETKAAVPAHA